MLAPALYQEVLRIHRTEAAPALRVRALYRVFEQLFIKAGERENLHHTTLFSRMAFVFGREQIDRQLQRDAHQFRKAAAYSMRHPDLTVEEEYADLGVRTVTALIHALLHEPVPPELAASLPPAPLLYDRVQAVKRFYPALRATILSNDREASELIGYAERDPSAAIRIRYNLPDRNEPFNTTIKCLDKTIGYPATVQLIDVELTEDGVYRPAAFVLEPDYLLDVSAIAQCFQSGGAEPIFYLLNRFLPKDNSVPLLLGAIANYFLDELMSNPAATFQATFPKVFRLNPLGFSLLTDRDILDIRKKSQRHWSNLKAMVLGGFAKQAIAPENCYLEPSFLSDTYGIQGRLDVFYPNGKQSAIVELKSGKAWRPNNYRISQSHFVQTLLYDLLIRSVYRGKIEPQNYILYSGEEQDILRYAPRIRSQQYEALAVRNIIVTIERQLQRPESDNPLFRRLRPDRYSQYGGFTARDLQLFDKVYGGMRPVERSYFNQFAAFVAREQQLAKTGRHGVARAGGQAALWLHSLTEKQANFAIIHQLELVEEQVREDEPIIVFNKPKTDGEAHQLANFRRGDIAVLYPLDTPDTTAVETQVFKCSVVSIDDEQVTVRLRFKQFNRELFEFESRWNLESDLMEHGFTGSYRSLFRWARTAEAKRRLLLTERPPARPAAPGTYRGRAVEAPADLTTEQQHLFREIVSAEEYYLLWGPPGTGKTSRMLHHLVKFFFEQSDEQILLLAYTNRAVDEICEAVEAIGAAARASMLRIGNSVSTPPAYRDRLLSTQLAKVNRRQELIDVLQQHRIFISTVASFDGKLDLLKLKQFDRVMIDEASQILEPQLVGMLPLFPKFLLIGDHKQLPAVVQQPEADSVCHDEALQALGLHNLRNSLFERMYRRCLQEKWDWALGRLSHQGRMHTAIMRFPNEAFYGSGLRILPPEIAHAATQEARLRFTPPEEMDALFSRLCHERVVYLPTKADGDLRGLKTNRAEAEWVVILVNRFRQLYAGSGKPLTERTIGIITPYRAQIALIRDTLREMGEPLEGLTIDTVERYQGGAREVIILSLCANHATQMDTLVSLSEEGVDRRLNVAMTRAKEHVIILGDEAVLGTHPVYRRLLDFCREAASTAGTN